MASPGKQFITYSKPKKSSGAFWYVSEGLLSLLHAEREKKNFDLAQLDEFRRTLLHYSSFLNLEPMCLYLLMSKIDPYTLDKFSQTCFHVLLAKGSLESLEIILNYEIHTLNKELYEWKTLLKFGMVMGNVTLRNTIASYLSKSIILNKLPNKPSDSKRELISRLEDYYKKLFEKYKNILSQQDVYKRTPIHYAALSKHTWCSKALHIILGRPEGHPSFSSYYTQISDLLGMARTPAEKYSTVLKDVSDIIGPDTYNKISSDYQEKLKRLLYYAINLKDINGHTALHLACHTGDTKIINLLIQHGADKSLKDNKSKKPLDMCTSKLIMGKLNNISQAIENGDTYALENLVNSGHDVNYTANEYLLNNLHMAVLSGRLLSKVIECEGDVNACEWNFYTPLHYACIKGNVADIRTLIQSGANVMALSQHELTPLHLACRYDRVEAVKELLKNKAFINAKDHRSKTPLILASKYGSYKAAEELLAFRADMTLVDFRGWNALHYASFYSKHKLVKLLVKWDSDQNLLVSTENTQGKTPAMLASNAKTRNGFNSNLYSALWTAASLGNLDLAKKLLRKGGNVNETTVTERRTPLMIVTFIQAAYSNHVLMVKFLLENGAKADMIDNNGNSALNYTQEDTNDKIKFMLQANSKKKPENSKSHIRTNSF